MFKVKVRNGEKCFSHVWGLISDGQVIKAKFTGRGCERSKLGFEGDHLWIEA